MRFRRGHQLGHGDVHSYGIGSKTTFLSEWRPGVHTWLQAALPRPALACELKIQKFAGWPPLHIPVPQTAHFHAFTTAALTDITSSGSYDSW